MRSPAGILRSILDDARLLTTPAVSSSPLRVGFPVGSGLSEPQLDALAGKVHTAPLSHAPSPILNCVTKNH